MRRVRPLSAQGGKRLLMREQVLAIAAAAFVQQGLGQQGRIGGCEDDAAHAGMRGGGNDGGGGHRCSPQ